MPSAKVPPTDSSDGAQIELVYTLKGHDPFVSVFEVSTVLASFGKLVREANREINPDLRNIQVDVRPFRPGSFEIDFVIRYLGPFVPVLANRDAIEQIKTALEYIGVIPKAKKLAVTLLDALRFLGSDEPEQVKSLPDGGANIVNRSGESLNITSQVHKLINNGTINQNVFNVFGGPLNNETIDSIRMQLRDDPSRFVEVPKTDASALRPAHPQPLLERSKRPAEKIDIEILNPVEGSYGETKGKWTFVRKGQPTPFKARITDEAFLSKIARGEVRFYKDDELRVRLREVTTTKVRTRTTREIIEVLKYTPMSD